MISARRVGRWVLIALGGVLLLLVLVWVGVSIYLNTSTGRAFVARQISNRIGMPVEVTRVRVGLSSSTIGLKVFDPHVTDPTKAEILSVDAANADTSLFALVRGDIAPKTVDVHKLTLKLHVSADGKVLTTIPQMPEGGGAGAMPQIDLHDGQITIDQDGRPEFAIHGLNISVIPNGDTLKLTGSVDDPVWSKWIVNGEVNKSAHTGSVAVAAEDVPATMDRLTSIPFVPGEVWQKVQINGHAAVAIDLVMAGENAVHYTLDLRPKNVSVTVPEAGVTLTKLNGEIRLTEKLVQLKQTQAELAGGSLTVNGEFDYTTKPAVAKLKVSASGLDIQQLPAEWGLHDFEGQLKGAANLTLRIQPDGKVEPLGGGDGTIENAKFRGIPVTVAIHLQGNGKQYRFEQGEKVGMKAPPAPLPAGSREKEKELGGGKDLGDAVTSSGCEAASSPSLQGGGCVGLTIATVRADFQPPTPSQPKTDPPAKKDAPNTLTVNIGLRDIEIAQLLEKLKLKIGYKISGKVTAQLALSVPMGGVTSSAAYEFSGTISSPELKLEGLTIRAVAAHATYKNGKLTLTELKLTVVQPANPQAEGGTISGSAAAAINPPGDVTASLALDRIPLAEVMKALPGAKIEVEGLVTGRAEAKAPYKQLSDPTTWAGSAVLTSPELVIAKRSAKNAKLLVEVAKGTATLKELSATVEEIPVNATGTLELTGKYPFSASLKTTGTNVADLRKLVPEAEIPAPVEGQFDTDTRAAGTLSPMTFSASGTIRATKLTLAKTPANSIEVKWQLTTEQLVISSLKAAIFRGTLTGKAAVPFAPDKAGSFQLNFKDLDVAAATPLIPDFPLQVGGQISGDIGGTIAPAKGSQSRVGTLNVDITAPQLTVQGIPADRLVGKATIKNGKLEYSLEGKTLGGSFELKGSYPGTKKKETPTEPAPVGAGWGGGVEAVRFTAQPAPKQTSFFRLTGADLSLLGPQLGIDALRPLRGRLDITFNFADDLSSGSGRILLTDVRWNATTITRELAIVVALRDGILQIVEVNGAVAGGFVRGRAQVRLNEIQRNYFFLSIEGADAKRLLAVIPQAAGMVDGPVTITLNGRVGREMRGSGSVSLTRGTISGVTVSDLLIPLTWATVPGGYGQVTIRGAKMNAGTGIAEGDLTLNWGFETRVDGQVKLINVPLRTLVPNLSNYAILGNGRITGRMDIAGSNVRSVDDLTGSLVATLGNTSPREIPLIQQAVPFLNTAGLVKPFDTGDVRATLSRGVVRIQRLVLHSPSAQMFADGTVTTSGRVDMNVIAHTGTIGPDAGIFRLLITRLPAFGPVPLTLLRDVSDAISNRTIRLSITGTTSDPVVRLNVGALLTEEAVRFFLSRYVIPSQYAAAAGFGSAFGAFNSSQK